VSYALHLWRPRTKRLASAAWPETTSDSSTRSPDSLRIAHARSTLQAALPNLETDSSLVFYGLSYIKRNNRLFTKLWDVEETMLRCVYRLDKQIASQYDVYVKSCCDLDPIRQVVIRNCSPTSDFSELIFRTFLLSSSAGHPIPQKTELRKRRL
jgi:hypothetical protein